MLKEDLLSWLHSNLEEWNEKLKGKDCDGITEKIDEIIYMIESEED